MKVHWLTLYLVGMCLAGQAQWTLPCQNPAGNGFVVDFCHFQNEVYATGFFTDLCGSTVRHVGRWDGDDNWSALGSGLPQPGHALAVTGNELYCANYAYNQNTNHVNKWLGDTWAVVGPTLTNNIIGRSPHVYDLLELGPYFYVSGDFNRANGQPASGILRINRATWEWEPLGSGLSGFLNPAYTLLFPHQLLAYGDDLVVVGNFKTAGGVTVNGIARWDGSAWSGFGEGFNGPALCAAVYQGELYAGGEFTQAGDSTVIRVARWNGQAWENPGFGLADPDTTREIFVHTLYEWNNRLVLAGGFRQVVARDGSTSPCGHIVAWDGTQVDVFQGGASQEVEALAATPDGLLVGGGTLTLSYLAHWQTPVSADAEPADLWAEATRLWPNPASDILHVQGRGLEGAWRWQITDAQGLTRSIVPSYRTGEVIGFEVGYLARGVYMLTAIDEAGGRQTWKWVKW